MKIGSTCAAIAASFASVFVLVACSSSSTTSPSTASDAGNSSSTNNGTGSNDAGSSTTNQSDSGGASDGVCTASSTPGTFKGSCEVSTSDFCIEFTGSAFTDQAQTQNACQGAGGTYSATTRCSTTDSAYVGRCLEHCGTSAEVVNFYASLDVGTWQQACGQANGTWLGK